MRAFVGVIVFLAGCPGGNIKHPAPELTAADYLAQLAEHRAVGRSFRTDSVMDYWLGDDRVKGSVMIMGEPGAKIRFNAFDPADNVLADLACNGADFVYVDRRNNCVLTGPCDQASIARLLRVPLSPDDFFHLALGGTPVLEGAEVKLSWNSDEGEQRLDLTSAAGTQAIVLDGKSATWDVLRSERKGADGKVIWSVTNTDYGTLTDEAGASLRVPGKTRFRSPDEKADLLVDWKERELNVTLPPQGFVLEPPAGLPTCGG